MSELGFRGFKGLAGVYGLSFWTQRSGDPESGIDDNVSIAKSTQFQIPDVFFKNSGMTYYLKDNNY